MWAFLDERDISQKELARWIANWVKVYFERAGFSAEMAHDGETGLARARDLAPDLVILDLMLPRLDGVQLCRILRHESDVPIIMLTAREAPAERITGLDSGADEAEPPLLRTAAGVPEVPLGERDHGVDWLRWSAGAGLAVAASRCTRTPSPALPRTG